MNRGRFQFLKQGLPAVLFLACLYALPTSALAQDRGNTTNQEYGDAVYRVLEGIAGFLGYDYNHAAVFAGLDSNEDGRVLQALGSGYVTHQAYFYTQFTSYGANYYGAYTLNNRAMSFTDRRNVVITAINMANAAIPYPSTFLEIPICLDYFGSSFDGSVGDVYTVRCDGFVEYCYERNGFRVWRNQDYVDSAWSIVLYPDIHNDRPDATRNPENEPSPWAQRGAPCATGPQVSGCGYYLPDTKMNRAAVVSAPTYQVTTSSNPGYVDVTIRATDVSGIHYIGYKKPGDADWSYSPTQPQHPTSDSYAYTVRVTSNGPFHYFAMDNGGNIPQFSSFVNITVPPGPISVTVQAEPPDRSFTVDGNTYSTAQTFSWTAGSAHNIGTTTTQNESPSVRYVWSNWSDGGSPTHAVSPAANTTYTVNFTKQLLLTMVAGAGGSVSPASTWQNNGAIVPIQATASSGYIFESWIGTGSDSYSGANSSASVTMNGPVTQTASFTKIISVTVRANPPGPTFSVDGTNYTNAQTFNWLAGSSHAVETTSLQNGVEGVQFLWSNWSDGGTLAHTVSPSNTATITANFATQYFLTTEAGPGGQVHPLSGWQNSGAVVPLLAEASDGYNFALWAGHGAGSYSGGKVSPTVTMNGPITNTASFTQAVCFATLLKPTNGVAVLLPPKFIWAFRENCHHKVYLTTNPVAGIVVTLTNLFAAGTNTLAVTETQWSNVVAELGEAADYFWTVGSADAGQPGAALFAGWQSFSLPDGSFQILEHLTNAIFAKGSMLNLNAAASSSNSLTYQWKFKKRPLLGATSSTLSISNAQTRHAGLYSVLVSDGASTVESGPITVKVVIPASIRSGPADRAVRPGKAAAFTVSAAGTKLLTYQWYFNGNPIEGATTRRLVVPAVNTERLGIYSVRVSNAVGFALSRNAVLTLK